MRRPPAVAAVLAASLVSLASLVLVGCGADTGDVGAGDPPSSGSTGSSDSSDQPLIPAPGDYPSSWEPTVPDAPVDPDSVADYAPVLDAVVASSGDGYTWGESELSTEEFDGLCVVMLQRAGTGSSPTDVAGLQADISAAITDLGFADLAPEADPGGAVKLVAHDDTDTLLEFRSKVETTVAVRVATVDTACG